MACLDPNYKHKLNQWKLLGYTWAKICIFFLVFVSEGGVSQDEMADWAFYFIALGRNDWIFPHKVVQRSCSGAKQSSAPTLQQALTLSPSLPNQLSAACRLKRCLVRMRAPVQQFTDSNFMRITSSNRIFTHIKEHISANSALRTSSCPYASGLNCSKSIARSSSVSMCDRRVQCLHCHHPC